MNLVIRGYANGHKQFEERVQLDPDAIEGLLPELAEKHAAALAGHTLHMIEIEFLDEPDPNERFFRFGTDPAGMVAPIAMRLG